MKCCLNINELIYKHNHLVERVSPPHINIGLLVGGNASTNQLGLNNLLDNRNRLTHSDN